MAKKRTDTQRDCSTCIYADLPRTPTGRISRHKPGICHVPVDWPALPCCSAEPLTVRSSIWWNSGTDCALWADAPPPTLPPDSAYVEVEDLDGQEWRRVEASAARLVMPNGDTYELTHHRSRDAVQLFGNGGDARDDFVIMPRVANLVHLAMVKREEETDANDDG